MKKIAKLTPASLLFLTLSQTAHAGTPDLRVDSGRHLTTRSGEPFFINADTAWTMPWSLNRGDVVHYVNTRKNQGFNTFAVVAFPWTVNSNRTNAYGDKPFESNNGRWDPSRRITTAGANPNNDAEYDYWDHLDYIVEQARNRGMKIIILPTWGHLVAGSWSSGEGSDIIFDEAMAYEYGNWLGARYGDSHIVWMLGGDRSAVYGNKDYRSEFRALAEGIADGTNGQRSRDGQANYSSTFMSYHPRKGNPNSSQWFHNDSWLDFNSIQEFAGAGVREIADDWKKTPPTPTWLFEGAYEERPGSYTPWVVRFQAYQTVFGGGMGHNYGHTSVFQFLGDWKNKLNSPGATDMTHLAKLMDMLSKSQYLNRIPNQDLVAGPHGSAQNTSSDRMQATSDKAGSIAMIYTASYSTISVNMNRLSNTAKAGYWFNPRNGQWHDENGQSDKMKPFTVGIPSGNGSSVESFTPPGSNSSRNDWVLVLRDDDGSTGPSGLRAPTGLNTRVIQSQ